MKLSIIILCWNDMKVISECVRSIYASTHHVDFEVIISDNGSTDGSPEYLERNYPSIRVIRNGANLGFARGNNAAIRVSRGELVLILNPDTLIHEGSLDRWVEFAEMHPEAGAFGCRVLNTDGSYQVCAFPFPNLLRNFVAALHLRFLGHFSERLSPFYEGWNGDSERKIDWQLGCCVMFRGKVLKELGGFDGQFFYAFEEVDLCYRVWQAGYPILFKPDVTITHLGGQSVNRFRRKFEVERYRSLYRYFYKHFGARGVLRLRRVTLTALRIQQAIHGPLQLVKRGELQRERFQSYCRLALWNKLLNPVGFAERGEEPDIHMANDV